jgi:type IV secretory pathway VirB2 component (pilin)
MGVHVSTRRRLQAVSAIGLAMLLTPVVMLAQTSPWERAAGNLATSFTGPLARSLTLVAIVLGGVGMMFGEPGSKKQIALLAFGGGITLFAGQFLAWLF